MYETLKSMVYSLQVQAPKKKGKSFVKFNIFFSLIIFCWPNRCFLQLIVAFLTAMSRVTYTAAMFYIYNF